MKSLRQVSQSILTILIIALLAIVIASFFVIGSLYQHDYEARQAALSPFFTLVSETILKPIYISQSMAINPQLISMLESDQPDEEALLAYISALQTQFKFDISVVSEKTMTNYTKNENYTPGTPGFDWYFKLRKEGELMYAGIGNPKNPHFYVNIRIMSERGELLGYTSAGININRFVSRFSHYHVQFDSMFYFVNNKGEILLSSETGVVTLENKEKVFLASEYDWYNSFDSANMHKDEAIVSKLDTINNRELVVSRIAINELDWHLYVLTKPKIAHGQLWLKFVSNALILWVIFLALLTFFIMILRYYNRLLIKEAYTDKLTQLSNRASLETSYAKLPANEPSSIVVIDIDHFKSINDRFGHSCGDFVLEAVAKSLTFVFRKGDTVARWGGEEFVVILSGLESDQALSIVDRCRLQLASVPIHFEGNEIKITASFGVFSWCTKPPLNTAIETADKALYEAKNTGRNKVVNAS